MKSLTFLLAFTLAIFVSNFANASNADSTEVVKIIEKTIKITDDGKVITTTKVNGKEVNDEDSQDPTVKKQRVIVFSGDDFETGEGMKWVDEDNMNVTVEMDGDSANVFVIKTPKGVQHFDMDRPMCEKHMVFRDMEDMPFPPPHMGNSKNKNLIDLNDPSIVSFQRETLKNGDEKITIIRKAPDKEDK